MESTLAIKPLASDRRDYTAIVLPVAIWVLAIVIIGPLGNFPLNDDFSYSLTVRTMLETGQFTPGGWTSMTLIGQTLWGALFCLPFGFSYTTLRISTLVAAALGLAALALLLQDAGCGRRKTVVATLAFGFNPLWLVLAVTFMTDVSFASLSILSTMAFCRFLRTRSTATLLIAMAFAIWALAVRQLALYLPMAMFGVLVLEPRRDWRAILTSAAAIVLSIALLGGLEAWLTARHVMPAMARASTDSFGRALATPLTLAIKLEQDVRGILVHIGWFLSPVLLWRAPSLIAQYRGLRRGRTILAAAAGLGLVWFVLMAIVHPLPLDWTTINDSGLGPIWLHSVAGTLPGPPPLPKPFWIFITFVAVGGAVLLLLELGLVTGSLIGAYRRRQVDAMVSIRAFLLLAACIYLVPLFVAGYFDRYLLVPTFTLLALAAIEWQSGTSAARTQKLPRPPRAFAAGAAAAAIFVLVLTGAYSVAGTHDYLSWNRARWSLLDALLKQGITPDRIDGGQEFDGTYLYDPDYAGSSSKSRWWVHDDEYIVQFGALDGYHIVGSADIDGWLPTFRTQLLALERNRH